MSENTQSEPSLKRIKRWSDYQHYKDRRPPWIKLHRTLLDDMEYHMLDPIAAKALPLVWLVASEYDGNLPKVEKLAFRLRVTVAECNRIVEALFPWLEQSASNALAGGLHGDSPHALARGEKEEEKEKEKEGEGERAHTRDSMPLDGWSWDQVKDVAGRPTCGVREATAQSYFDARTAAGWVDAAGRATGRTAKALESDLRKWAVAEASHGKRGGHGGGPELKSFMPSGTGGL